VNPEQLAAIRVRQAAELANRRQRNSRMLNTVLKTLREGDVEEGDRATLQKVQQATVTKQAEGAL
jgi:hypothetical protein